MATSPSHRFGQQIGNLLEEILVPLLREFTDGRGLYLDSQGERAARTGKKVSWEDKYGNSHDLDFVIERGGSEIEVGRPVAFIEAAWRRYTKHSRNKAQEIQGAILPVAEKHEWNRPFLGSVLAGVFTDGSLTQMRSVGFNILLFPYESIVGAFAAIGIDAAFDEETPDTDFEAIVRKIDRLDENSKEKLKAALIADNQAEIRRFLDSLAKALDRVVHEIFVIPLSGSDHRFADVAAAAAFIDAFDETVHDGVFRKFEIIVKYSNGDRIDATFADKGGARDFLAYISS